MNKGPDFTLGILLAAAIHAGIFYWLSTEDWTDYLDDEAEEVIPLNFEPVELLMWGEEMPNPNELPVIANPDQETQEEEVVDLQPEPPDPEEVAVVQEEEEELPVEREPEEREEEQRRDNQLHNPDRPVNNEPIQGSQDGTRGGNSLSESALANVFSQLQGQINRSIRPPRSLSASQLATMSGRIRIHINTDGRILRYSWVERTGNRALDGAVEQGLNTFRLGSSRLRLPADQRAIDAAVSQGLILELSF
ncbi:MAG: hypothetical protein KC561_00035 [Myxococcales bacterium]|nr:hypothetical protein [Myxococcales bacterium]